MAEEVKSSFNLLLESQFFEFLARQSKFVQRKSKLTGVHFSTMMIFANGSLTDTSLWELCEEFQHISNVRLKKQSLHDRFNEHAVRFLKLLLESVLSRQITKCEFSDLLPNQNRILIKDSTCFQLPEHLKDIYPGSGGATSSACIKIQFEYDLKTGTVNELSIGGFTTTDLTNSYQTKNRIEISDLLIRDLGYIGLDFLEIIQEKSAFFLNRIKSFRRFCWRIIIINSRAIKEITSKLEKFIENVFDNCMLEKRKGKLSSMEIIEGLCQI